MTVRTRFAPSPTGPLHLGNARTAVLNWAFTRRHEGRFVLRFEDTDVGRNVAAAEEEIVDGLSWLGLTPDEGPEQGGPFGPYRQSERLEVYRGRAERLLDEGCAYHCYCTPDELEARREAALEAGDQPTYDGRCRELDDDEEARLRSEGRTPSVRFRVDPGPVEFHDRVRGDISIDGGEFGDFVILRSDGRPTYNFAVVVDDLLMEISHVIRGAGHLPNTPKQVLLYRAFGARPPEFVHVPLVLAPEGDRMSKRERARPLSAWRDAGYHPDAVVNHLSLLSWSSETGDEFLPRDRIVEEVDLDRLGRSDARVDPEKMEWLSGRHVRAESPERLAERLRPRFEAAGLELTDAERVRAAEVLRGRIQLLTEAVEEAEALYREPRIEGEARDALGDEAAPGVLEAALDALEGLDEWGRDRVREAVEAARRSAPAGGRGFYHPLRAALTGALEGPELPDVVYMLGRRRTVRRLRRGLRTSAGDGDRA